MIVAGVQRAGHPIRARAATTAMFLANGSGIGAWAASISGIKQALRLSDAALGLGLLCFAVGAILTMPAAGWLGLRWGSHRVTIGAGLACVPALLLPALAPDLVALMGATLLLGAAKGMMDVSMNAHATGVEQVWGAPIMSSFHAAFSLGGLAGSASVGLLLGFGLTAQACLALAAGWVGLLVVVGWLAGLDRAMPRAVIAVEKAPGFAWPSAALLGLGLLAFLALLVEGGMADWSGVFLATVAGASTALAAAGYAAFSVAMAVGRLVGDRFVAAVGHLRAVRLGAGLAAGGLALALLAPVPAAGLAGFALVGFGAANVIPVLFTAAGRIRGTAPSVGVAMAATVGYAGFLAGPPIIGLVADAIGLRLALAILLLAAAIVAGLVGRIIARF
jgi:predicted MFS family arabinose efflux permease